MAHGLGRLLCTGMLTLLGQASLPRFFRGNSGGKMFRPIRQKRYPQRHIERRDNAGKSGAAVPLAEAVGDPAAFKRHGRREALQSGRRERAAAFARPQKPGTRIKLFVEGFYLVGHRPHSRIQEACAETQGRPVSNEVASTPLVCSGREGRGRKLLCRDSAYTRRTGHSVCCRLYSAGVKFVPTDGDLTTIRFDQASATLYLPKVRLDTNTEVIIRNLAAFEASAVPGTLFFIRYTDFMNGIIDTDEDVRLL
ncbi:hypothetical protein SUGI_0720430 [Cryptomeria japonica]|nr:hypothetical protein SUGI_0720430 [Cryptomeria japonica]